MCLGEHASSMEPLLVLEDDIVSLMQPQRAWGLPHLQPPRPAVLLPPTQGGCMGRGAARKHEAMVTQIMESTDSGFKNCTWKEIQALELEDVFSEKRKTSPFRGMWLKHG